MYVWITLNVMNICLLKTGMYWNVDGWYAGVEYGMIPNTNSWWCCVQCYIRINSYVSLLVNYIRILHTDLSVCITYGFYIRILHTDLSVCNNTRIYIRILHTDYIRILHTDISVCNYIRIQKSVCNSYLRQFYIRIFVHI